MENEHVLDLIPEYLDGSLDNETMKDIQRHLEKCPQCQQEVKEMEALLKAFKNDVVPVPSERLRSRFEEALDSEKASMGKVVPLSSKKRTHDWASSALKIAASIALLVASFQMGSVFQQKKIDQELANLKDENLNMKQTAMLSLMENQSASKRIQGVAYIEEFENPDEAIIQALANRLLNDENDNVRLTAFEALSKYTSSETVKHVLIEALEKEKNPSIQVAIIQTLVQIQEKKAAEPMKKLLENEDTQPFIKEQIKAVLPSLT